MSIIEDELKIRRIKNEIQTVDIKLSTITGKLGHRKVQEETNSPESIKNISSDVLGNQLFKHR